MKTKEMKGITLIALVITIVVLLILAGVSINLLLGDNGIITKAKEAKDSYSKSAVKEKVGFLLNEYKMPWEQIGIIGVSEKHVKNITISNLNFENGDVSIVENPNESIQLRGAYCDNIEINNCKFNVYEIENNKSRQITNLWFHTEWKNITIENCDLKNLTNSNIGGNIWMSNFSNSYISQNAIIKNNYIQKSCHDEVIGVWGGNIDNVLIKNNNIYVEESKVTDRSRMNFTFGNDGILTNLQFIDNNINCQSKDFFIYINGKDGSKNIYISNNKIRYSVESNEPIIYTGMINNSGKNDNVEVSSNEIEYLSNSVLNVFSATKEQYVGNKIKISANTRNLFSGDSEYYDNIFEINGDVQERIINNISIFKNNMITINGNAPPYIINPQKNLARDLNIENNKFILNDTEEWNVLSKHFIFLYNIELNNYNINILNNTLICPNQSTMQYLIQMHSINDIVSRTINMENNKYDIFKDIVFYNNKINHKVLVDGIEIKDSTILE